LWNGTARRKEAESLSAKPEKLKYFHTAT